MRRKYTLRAGMDDSGTGNTACMVT